MYFTINIQLKVSKNCIENLKRHFLCNKKKINYDTNQQNKRLEIMTG